MGYLHIENLYKSNAQKILEFKRVYALEKIHGTSAHIRMNDEGFALFSGGESPANFEALLGTDLPNPEDLRNALVVTLSNSASKSIVIYGELYGGKCQGMRDTYGDRVRFIAFDVMIDGKWLAVDKAKELCDALKIPFVFYEISSTDLTALDACRDRPSTQAKRNGIEGDKVSEGVILRPPYEVILNNGERLIAKHKAPQFRERTTVVTVNEVEQQILSEATKIADEWVTDMRLTHVLDKLGNPTELSRIPDIVAAMVEDVVREAGTEIVDSKPARKAIGAKTVKLYKNRVMIPNMGLRSSD